MNNENVLGYIPNFRILKENAIPTINLPPDSDVPQSCNHGITPEDTTRVNNN